MMAIMDAETARLCRAADPVGVGLRLRGSRVAQGLTQGQLAEGLASVAQVSRIESGQRRGDPELLEKLAARLGVSLLDLVHGEDGDRWGASELKADYAELALASGDLEAASRLCGELSGAGDLPAALRRRVDRVRSGALEAAGDLRGAIEMLESINAAGRRDLAWIKDLIALCRCHREAGDPMRAIQVARDAQAQIDLVGLAGTTEAIQLTVTVALSHADLGDITTAIERCGAAVAKADEINSPIARASAYWNASIFESRQGHHQAAIQLARSALAQFERGEDARNLGRLRALVGQLLLRLDPPHTEEAIQTLDQAHRELAWSSAGVIERARCDLFLARAHFYDGNLDVAADLLQTSLDVVAETAPDVHAHALVLAGEIAFATGDTDTARSHYQDAAHVLTAMGADRTAGGYWIELATLLESVDDKDGALAAYRSAAASAGLVAHIPGRQPTPSS